MKIDIIKSIILFFVACIFGFNLNAQNCYINLSQSEVQFSLAGGSTQIDITPAGPPTSGCSNPIITLFDVPSWLTASVSGGTIYVSTNSSLSSGHRNSSVAVKTNGTIVSGFTVKQGTEPPPPPPPPCSISGFGGSNSFEMFSPSGGAVTYPLTFTNCTQNSATFTFTKDGTQPVPSWINMNQTGSSISVNCSTNTGPGRSAVIVARATIGGEQVTVSAQISQGTCLSNWYLDDDGDGFGDPNTVVATCSYPNDGSVYVENNQDCDDTRKNINPNTKWYADTDNDGFGEHDGNVIIQCSRPNGYSDNNDDWCPGVVGQEYGCPNQTGVYNENYIHSISPQVGMNNLLDRSNNDNFIEGITYYDDLGRPKQAISKQAGGNRQDIITPIVYDAYGKKTKEYLPYANPTPITPSLVYRNHNTLLQNLTNYYSTNYSEDINSANPNPNSEKDIERSPINRLLKQAAPGNDWRLGNGHEIEFDYKTNVTNDQVRLFTVTLSSSYAPSLVNSGLYGAGELYKTITKDENHTGSTKNHTTEEFKDKQGRVVLKRTYSDTDLNSNASIGTGETEVPHETYYVYDKFGNLTYVIPPKVTTASISSTELDELCYQYRYDNQNRLIEKKIPGKGVDNNDWEEIVYNKLHQPILTRDPLLKSQNKWLFTKYDAFGRVAYTGLLNSTSSRSTMQTNANNFGSTLYVLRGNAISLGSTIVYYNNAGYPNTGTIEILTVNYYDDYEIGNQIGFNPTNGSGTWNGMTATANVKGLSTVSRTKVLEQNNKWITTATYYDYKGRPWETYLKNEYLDVEEWTLSQLDDFTGRVLKTRTIHTKGNNPTIVTVDMFVYDHMGRLFTQKQCVGDGSLPDDCGEGDLVADLPPLTGDITTNTNAVASNSITLSPNFHVIASPTLSFSAKIESGEGELIVKNNFDELGKMDSKQVGNNENMPLQTVDYTYNIRGWLKQINDPASIGNDLFAFKIGYNEGSNALYNGNIALTQWKTKSADQSLKTYNYTYDALNRILTGTDNTGRYNLNSITYDKNGNITSLNRSGHIVANPNSATPAHFGVMDNLTYSYDSGNKLLKVADASAIDEFGFKDDAVNTTTDSSNDYTYDENGNMKTDTNKGITAIAYNHLNLPTTVTISGQNILYIYDAVGTKLKKVMQGINTDYAGNYIYENGILQFFNHSEGYVTPDSNGGYDYVYQYKDHIGNIRLSYSDNDSDGIIQIGVNDSEILEENNYYPFGLKHKGYNNSISANANSVASKFKYNGIEYEENLNLNLYEMDVRSYDPAIARFTTIDPVIHYSMSPYISFDGNPVFWADPSGANALHDFSKDIYGRDKFNDNGVFIAPINRGAKNYGQGVPPKKETPLQKIARTTITTIADKANESSDGIMAESANDKHVTAFQLFYQWVHGTGPETRNFDENSVMGKQMLQAPKVLEAMDNAARLAHCEDNCSNYSFSRRLKEEVKGSPLEYINGFFKDIDGLNPARGFHGSYAGSIMINGMIPEAGGTWVDMTVSIQDKMTAESGTRLSPAVGGYDENNPVTVYPEENPYGPNGQFRTISVNYSMKVKYFIPAN